jgi:hypothetical protein
MATRPTTTTELYSRLVLIRISLENRANPADEKLIGALDFMTDYIDANVDEFNEIFDSQPPLHAHESPLGPLYACSVCGQTATDGNHIQPGEES